MNENQDKVFNKTSINWFPGHMKKTRDEMKKILDLIDIIYEVVDARTPNASRIKDIDTLTKSKIRIMIMTKYDLCDKSITNKYIEKYKELGYSVIAMDLKHDSGKKILELTEKLLEDQNKKRLSKGLLNRCYRAMVVGVPNVGKSTLINTLANRKVAQTGNRAGVTKKLTWINVNKTIALLDTPGILWPKIDDNRQALNLASFSLIKEEILDLEEVVSYIIEELYKNYKSLLQKRYNITTIEEKENFYSIIAKKYGAYQKNKEIDYNRVNTIIYNDLKNGNIGQITFM